MIILKRLLISGVILLIVQCKHKNQEKVPQTDISITQEGVFYHGKKLPFDKDISEWEKIFGKPREFKFDSTDLNSTDFVWDKLGIRTDSRIADDSQEYSYKIIRGVSFYYRNLDSKLGRTGQLGRYLPVNGYSHFLPEDRDRNEEIGLTKEEDSIINEMMKDMPKKTDFVLPLLTHKKPILIRGIVIDSTMNVQKINKQLEKVNIEPFYYTPAIGGVNSMNSDARFNTTGKYNGVYKTNFGTAKQQYELELVNMLGEVVYIKVRPYTQEEMKEYRKDLKK